MTDPPRTVYQPVAGYLVRLEATTRRAVSPVLIGLAFTAGFAAGALAVAYVAR